ncbi:MAG: hypothetical protein AAB646_03200 [Patescibacteria group bacterium]
MAKKLSTDPKAVEKRLKRLGLEATGLIVRRHGQLEVELAPFIPIRFSSSSRLVQESRDK